MAKVIVIGAGPAGLSAAFHLKQHGIEVQVLEKEGVPGGRVRSVRHNGFIIDRGASFLSSAYRETFELINQLGLQNELQPLETALRFNILRDGRFHRVDYSSHWGPFLNSAVPFYQRMRLPLMLWPVLSARCHGADFTTLGGVDRFDDESVESYVVKLLGRDMLDYFFEPFLKLMWGWESKDTSKALLTLLGAMGQQKVWSLKGGLGTLTEVLASRLKVSYQTEVISVNSLGNTVEIKYRSGDAQMDTVVADAVILAVPSPVVLNLWKGIPLVEKQFLNQIRYLPSIAVHFAMADDFGENIYGYLFPKLTGKRTAGIGLEHRRLPQNVPPGHSLLYTGPSVDDYEKLAQASDDAIAKWCLSDLRDVFGKHVTTKYEHYVFRWEHALPVLHVGAIRALSAYRNRDQQKPIFLAGDYMAAPCVEGAVSSGRRAAQQVVSSLSHSC